MSLPNLQNKQYRTRDVKCAVLSTRASVAPWLTIRARSARAHVEAAARLRHQNAIGCVSAHTSKIAFVWMDASEQPKGSASGRMQQSKDKPRAPLGRLKGYLAPHCINIICVYTCIYISIILRYTAASI